MVKNCCQEVKVNMMQVFLLVSLLNILVLLQNKCVLYAQWLLSSASKARSGSRHLSSRLVKYSPLVQFIVKIV